MDVSTLWNKICHSVNNHSSLKMFDLLCCFWFTHSRMTVNILWYTRLKSYLLGGHTSGVKFRVVYRSSSVLLRTRGVLESKSRHSPAASQNVWQQLFQQQYITVTCIISFHPWMHENHTSAPEPGDTDWNRHTRTCLSETSAWGTSMSWISIWLKRAQQATELHWSSDLSVARLF